MRSWLLRGGYARAGPHTPRTQLNCQHHMGKLYGTSA